MFKCDVPQDTTVVDEIIDGLIHMVHKDSQLEALHRPATLQVTNSDLRINKTEFQYKILYLQACSSYKEPKTVIN